MSEDMGASGKQPSAVPLYDLPRDQWDRFTNYGYLELRKARGASEPMLWRGGEPPTADGTKLSVWWPGDRDRRLSGSWTAATASEDLWKRLLRRDGYAVFRYRDRSDLHAQPLADTPSDRVADALERIADLLAKAIEARQGGNAEGGAVNESAVPAGHSPEPSIPSITTKEAGE